MMTSGIRAAQPLINPDFPNSDVELSGSDEELELARQAALEDETRRFQLADQEVDPMACLPSQDYEMEGALENELSQMLSEGLRQD